MDEREMNASIDALLLCGDLERVGPDHFRLTAQGIANAEALMRRHGVDPAKVSGLSLNEYMSKLGLDEKP